MASKKLPYGKELAEGTGFEPVKSFRPRVFETRAIGHYANPPRHFIPWSKLISINTERSTLEWIRTIDLDVRNVTLYPAELRGLVLLRA